MPLAIALALGAVAALGLTQLMKDDPAPRAPSPDAAGLVDGDGASSAPSSDRRAPGSPRLGPEAIEALRAEKATEAERAQRADYTAFARAYEAQKVDPAWAAAKENELLDANVNDLVKGSDAVPTDLDVDCRGTICRIQADFKSRGQGEDWISLYPLAVGAGMPNLSYEWGQGPDGKPRVIVYGQARQ